MFLACTLTENVPVCVGVPEIKLVAPSQLKPEGRPDAEYQVGLLFAIIWYLNGAPIMPKAPLPEAMASVAGALSTEPKELLTTTVYVPAWLDRTLAME